MSPSCASPSDPARALTRSGSPEAVGVCPLRALCQDLPGRGAARRHAHALGGGAAKGQARELVNGLAAVVPACGMLLVAGRPGRPGGADPGTVPYVKTMIRERNSAAYRAGSVAYHAAAPAAAACLSPWPALPFTAYLARAAALPGRGLRAPVVGAVEIACSLALLTTLLLVF
ncbi:hypothetical protein [Streptomyces yangpuensis]|uniref:hypothetical protein n=1 Tax=Streptomyces yangpuensis TaxID=1648182 RepID=UPI003655C45C